MDKNSLSERSRRESIDAFSIKLADGNFWGFALPRARLRPKVIHGVDSLGRPTESIEVVSEVGYPIEIRRLITDLSEACERGESALQHEKFFRLAASLIQRAHEIDLLDVYRLLEIDLDDLPVFVEAVLSVVTGECLETTDSPETRDAHV